MRKLGRESGGIKLAQPVARYMLGTDRGKLGNFI
jgi:hypothetical protein